MAFFVLVGLIAVLVVYISLVKNKKRAVLISVVILGVFYLYVSRTCGPNSADVKVMKPMAQKISEYIIKNGIPESLKDIADLPYELVGCERSEEYLVLDNGSMRFASEKEAELYNYREECHFKNIELSYWLQKDLHHKSQVTISLKMVSTNRTVYDTGLAMNKNNRFMNMDTKIGSYKNTGICNPMKQ